MEDILEENREELLLAEDTEEVKDEYRKIETLLNITFTKDEIEDFYSKFAANPLIPNFAA